MAIDTLGANALASNSVTTAKIANDAVTGAKIPADAVVALILQMVLLLLRNLLITL